ncbi:hypothetical protein RJ640_027065, partial [Escallonia rubra]
MDFCSSIEKLTNLSSLFVYSAAEHEILDLQSLSSAPQFLRTLELGGRLEKLPHWIPYLHSLVTLWLCYSQLGDDPLQSLEALPNLELLGFLQAYEGESLTFKAGGFQRLKVLWLRRLKGLRSLTMEDGAMPHLEEIYFHNCKLVDELPLGIQHLTNLQFLRLDDMPDKLTMPLQVQGVRSERCSVRENSKFSFHIDSFERRVIEINGRSGSCNTVTEIGKLTRLRRLGITKLRSKDGMDFCSSIEKLTNLSSLFVYSAAEHEILDLQSLSSAPQFLRTLELGGRLEKLPHWIPYLHSLVTLWLCYSQLGDDPLQSLEALPNLELLGFLQAYEGESLTFKAGGFQRLKVLWLRRLKGLRSLTMEDGAMPHLEEIYFHNCKLVDELPLGIQHLTNLQFLRLDDMPDKLTMPLQVQGVRSERCSVRENSKFSFHIDSFERRVIEINGRSGSCNTVTEIGKLTRLRRLGITKLRSKDGMDFCSSIEKLTNLSSLFVYSAAEHEILDLQSLSSAPQFLRTLELGGRLEKLPHWIPYLHSLVTLWLCYSQLGDDPLQSLEALPNLELLGFLQAYEGESLTFKAGGFQRLKVLWLRRLKGLRSLTMEDGAMPHLEEIYFHNCKLVDELPLGIQHLTNLQFLRLDDMPDKLTMPLQVQ